MESVSTNLESVKVNGIPAYMGVDEKLTTLATLYKEACFLGDSMAALAYMLEQLHDEVVSKLSFGQQDMCSFVIESLRRNRRAIEAITPDHDGIKLCFVQVENTEGGAA